MEGFNFERSAQPHSSENVENRERLTVDEIRGQLEHTTYEEALTNLKNGDKGSLEYLETYQGNLVDWMNDILFKEGTLKEGNEEVLAEVKRRLDMVSEALEQK